MLTRPGRGHPFAKEGWQSVRLYTYANTWGPLVFTKCSLDPLQSGIFMNKRHSSESLLSI